VSKARMPRCVQAELHCYHCGYGAARLEVEAGLPLEQAQVFSPANGPGYRRRGNGTLGCVRYDGPLYLDEVEVRPAYAVDQEDALPRSRRGRPRKAWAARVATRKGGCDPTTAPSPD
jgi:hypothetical protein